MFIFIYFKPFSFFIFVHSLHECLQGDIICVLQKRRRKKGREGRRKIREQDTVTPDPGCGAWLTIGSGGSQLTGRLCHVLCQQLPVGDPRGHLPVQLLIQELLHSRACRETAAKATGLFGTTQGWQPRRRKQTQTRARPWGAWPGAWQNILFLVPISTQRNWHSTL